MVNGHRRCYIGIKVCARCLFRFCFYAVALVEAVNTSSCIDELLLACVEWVASGADFNVDVLDC